MRDTPLPRRVSSCRCLQAAERATSRHSRSLWTAPAGNPARGARFAGARAAAPPRRPAATAVPRVGRRGQGRLTRGELRSPAWRRLFRDVYACADVTVTHEVRTVAAAALLLPGAVVSGRSGAVLWGVDAATTFDDVELTVPPGSPVTVVPGVRVRRRHLDPDQITTWRWVRVTSPLATAVDLARHLPIDDAVVLLDQLVVARLTTLAAVRAAVSCLTGRGCRNARAAADLADGLSGSPQETRLRLLMHRAGLPEPVAQYVIRDDAGFVARVDFAWPEKRVVVEYEGLWHRDPRQFAADRRRLNRLIAAGWRVVFVTAADLHRPEELLRRIAAALAA